MGNRLLLTGQNSSSPPDSFSSIPANCLLCDIRLLLCRLLDEECIILSSNIRHVLELLFLEFPSPAPEEEANANDKKKEKGEADCQDVSQSS